MHRSIRLLGTLLAAAGVLTLAWVVVVWRWEDPFTAIYTHPRRRRDLLRRAVRRVHLQGDTPLHRVEPDVAVLRDHGRELLRLQACHPRFFATHRYIVDAKLVSVVPALKLASS